MFSFPLSSPVQICITLHISATPILPVSLTLTLSLLPPYIGILTQVPLMIDHSHCFLVL